MECAASSALGEYSRSQPTETSKVGRLMERLSQEQIQQMFSAFDLETEESRIRMRNLGGQRKNIDEAGEATFSLESSTRTLVERTNAELA
jgi:hypothetical protein